MLSRVMSVLVLVSVVVSFSGCKVAKDSAAVAEEPAAVETAKSAPVVDSKAAEKAAIERAIAAEKAAKLAAEEKAKAEQKAQAALAAQAAADKMAKDALAAAEETLATARDMATAKEKAESSLYRTKLCLVMLAVVFCAWLLWTGRVLSNWYWRQVEGAQRRWQQFRVAVAKKLQPKQPVRATVLGSSPVVCETAEPREVVGELLDAEVVDEAVAGEDEFADRQVAGSEVFVTPPAQQKVRGMTGAEAAARCAERAAGKKGHRRDGARPTSATVSLGDLVPAGEDKE